MRVVYELTKKGGFSKDFELKNRVRRSAVSVMAKIAEGFHRNSNKGFGGQSSRAFRSRLVWPQTHTDGQRGNRSRGEMGFSKASGGDGLSADGQPVEDYLFEI